MAVAQRGKHVRYCTAEKNKKHPSSPFLRRNQTSNSKSIQVNALAIATSEVMESVLRGNGDQKEAGEMPDCAAKT